MKLNFSNFVKGNRMETDAIYLMPWGEFGAFKYMSGTGDAVFHGTQGDDTQSSWAIKPEKIKRPATADETKEFWSRFFSTDEEN